MTFSSSSPSYGATARLLHWLVALLVLVQLVIAWTIMPHIGRNTQPVGLVAWHLGIGTAVLFFVLIRIVWRATHKAPALPTSLSAAQRFIAYLTHGLLYALLLVIPVLGWMNASARGFPVHLFGIVTLPALVDTGSKLGRSMGDIHTTLAIVFAVLIGLHILAALFHRFVLRDNILKRMLSD